MKWPLNLILSPNYLERNSNVFRYLFPIRLLNFLKLTKIFNRLVSLDLQRIWLTLIKKYNTFSTNKLGKAVILLRNQISFVLENLWSYFHLDVLAGNWIKLEENIKTISDFDELRKTLDNYIGSITKQIFFNYNAIVKAIFEICNNAKTFISLINR